MINQNLKNANILIVDDQIANVEVLKDMLEMQEYTNVNSTTDPREVLKLFESLKPDLLLLDLAMPYIDGYQIMEQLNPFINQGEFFPILVLTADITPEARKKALSGGAKDFLTKPFDLIEVNLRIKNLLETRYFYNLLENQNQILEEKVKERTAELENTNKELIIAKEKAEKSDRLKTAFLNNISHEIRTPLNGILGFAPFILDSSNTEKEKNEYLDILNISADRLVQTINDYMDISLLTSNNIEPQINDFSAGEFLENLYEEFIPLFEKQKLKLTIKKPENFGAFILNTDKNLLKKAMGHMIKNSLKFTKIGEVTIGAEISNGKINFYIKDTGVGISEEGQKVVFDIFMQEDVSSTRGYEGSGLGLSIVKQIIKLLGGNIELDSVKGVGSKFSFNLPIKEKTEHINEIIADTIEKTEKSRPLVLIAEDDMINYLFMEKVLKKDNEVLWAKDGEEAINMCIKHPEIDLVLMDIKMPNVNGIDATKQIKVFRKNLTIIAITAYNQLIDQTRCLNAGCAEFVTKPIPIDKLRNIVQSHLSR